MSTPHYPPFLNVNSRQMLYQLVIVVKLKLIYNIVLNVLIQYRNVIMFVGSYYLVDVIVNSSVMKVNVIVFLYLKPNVLVVMNPTWLHVNSFNQEFNQNVNINVQCY